MKIETGQVAVVTGGAGGIGLGMARAFAGAGMKVVLADVRKDTLDDAVDELRGAGHDVIGVPTDVSQRTEVDALAAAALDAFGAVHVVCNNAGVGMFAPLSKLSLDDWEWMLSIDLWGPIHGVKTFVPILEESGGGHISATSSIAGLLAAGGGGAYNVAKHGVVALMMTLERELRAAGSSVHASVLCPGAVDTDIGANSIASRRARRGDASPRSAEGDELGRALRAALASGMQPDDVGRLVLDAIEHDRFWILTDDSFLAPIQAQVARMADDRGLTSLGRR